MKPFRQEMLYEYPLKPQDLVVEVGAYKGEWTKTIYDKYKCWIIAFEPVKEFYDIFEKNIKGCHSIEACPCGLGRETCEKDFKVSGDSSGQFNFNEQATSQTVPIMGVKHLMMRLSESQETDSKNNYSKFIRQNYDNPALISINCEGGEYELLEAILDFGLVKRFQRFQIQFHRVIPDAEERRNKIRERLSETHTCTFNEDFCWEGWEIKP